MAENVDFTLIDLLDEAVNDESWEPDPELRKQLVMMFNMQLSMY